MSTRIIPVPGACALFAALAFATRLIATTPPFTQILVPATANQALGGITASYPFDLGSSTMHYQQIFHGSDFSVEPGSTAIAEIAFRPSTAANDVDNLQGMSHHVLPLTLVDSAATIKLYTLPAGSTLSTSFSANTQGKTATTVYAGYLYLSSSYTSALFAGTGGQVLPVFDIRVHLSAPYPFDPAKNDLLMDVTLPSSVGTTDLFDAWQDTANRRAYSTSVTSDAATVDKHGLVTQFTFGNFAYSKAGGGVGGVAWMMDYGNDFSHLYGASGGPGLLNFVFNNASCFLMSDSYLTNNVPSGWQTLAAVRFTGGTYTNPYNPVANLQAALHAGGWATGIVAVAHDNEAWGATSPSTEQGDPQDYEALFTNLAHACGYAALGMPALDLAQIQANYGNFPTIQAAYEGMTWPVTLRTPGGSALAGFPAITAFPHPEVYEIQAQRFESTIDSQGFPNSDYEKLVKNATDAALGVDAAPLIYAGVKTQGSTFLVDEMCQAVYDTATLGVSGYWLNTSSSDYAKGMTMLQVVAVNATAAKVGTGSDGGGYYEKIKITNNTPNTLAAGTELVIHDLGAGYAVKANGGYTTGTLSGDTYVNPSVGAMAPNASYTFKVYFTGGTSPSYSPQVFSNIGT